MSKEFFKTALLNILVLLSLVLAFNIWFDKELWSDGYSSFVYSFENIFPFLSDDVYIDNSEIAEESKFAMEWIAVTNQGKRSVIYFGDGDFSAFEKEIAKIKASILKAGTVSEIAEADFKNVFKSGSVAVKFASPVTLYEYFEKGSENFDNISSKTELFLLTFSEDNSAKYIYFADSETNIAYRMPVKYDIGELGTLVSARLASTGGSDSYAFELNFDKEADGVDRILFDSFVPITTQTKSLFKPEVKEVFYDSLNSFDPIFKAFDIKKNSARSYKDIDNVLNYLETYSTLKIREDGSFSYSTDNYQKGIYIGKSNITDDVVNFANSLYRDIAGSDGKLILKDIKENEKGESVYGLIYSDGSSKLLTEKIYGTVVKVKDGYITGYEQKPLNIEKSSEAFFTGSVIEAYDRLYNSGLQKGKESLKIKKILPMSYYNGETVEPKWYIEFSDGSFELL